MYYRPGTNGGADTNLDVCPRGHPAGGRVSFVSDGSEACRFRRAQHTALFKPINRVVPKLERAADKFACRKNHRSACAEINNVKKYRHFKRCFDSSPNAIRQAAESK